MVCRFYVQIDRNSLKIVFFTGNMTVNKNNKKEMKKLKKQQTRNVRKVDNVADVLEQFSFGGTSKRKSTNANDYDFDEDFDME